MKKFFTKKRIIIIIVIAAVIGAAGYFKFARKAKIEYTTVKAEKGMLTQTVSETGTVKTAQELNLNFLNTGKIVKMAAKVGDQAKKDQVLAELDYAQLAIRQKQAESSLASALASLAKLIAGATGQDIAVAETGANQARQAYDAAVRDLEKIKRTVGENIAQAKKRLDDLTKKTVADVTPEEQAAAAALVALDNAKKTAELAVNNSLDSAISTMEDKLRVANVALDNVNKVLKDSSANNLLGVMVADSVSQTKQSYVDAKSLAIKAETNLAIAKSGRSEAAVDAALGGVSAALNKTLESLSDCYYVLENTLTQASFPSASLDAYKTTISGQQTTASAAITAVTASQQVIKSAALTYNTSIAGATESLNQAEVALNNAVVNAQNAYASARLSGDQQITSAQSRADAALKAYEVARAQFDKIKARARTEDIALAEAQVRQAEADVESAKLQIENSIVKAPIDGVITKVNYETGEDFSPSKPVFVMLGENNLEIEILVSEADIAKVNLGDKAAVTLDAFGSDVSFQADVFFVEPASTVVQDVVYYKVKVKFIGLAETETKYGSSVKVRPGMTANAVITTEEKNDTLIIPGRAIVEKADGAKIIRVLQADQSVREVPAVIGLRGDEGRVEVLFGDLKAGDDVVTFVKE